jgi:hypothetical protein
METMARCVQSLPSHPVAMLCLLVLITGAGCGNDFEEVHGNASNEAVFTAPLLKSPVDDEVIDLDNPTLAWFAVPNAVAFEVEISVQEDFEFLEDQFDDIPTTSYMLTDFPMDEGRHFWRVRARNAFNDVTPWSAVSSFTVVNTTINITE